MGCFYFLKRSTLIFRASKDAIRKKNRLYFVSLFVAFLYGLNVFFMILCSYVGSVVGWLERRECDRHCLGSKPTRAILLCPWERHFPLLGGFGKQF